MVTTCLDIAGEGDPYDYELEVAVDEDGDCADIVSAVVMRAVDGAGRYVKTPLRGTELTEKQLEGIFGAVQSAYTEDRRGAHVSREYGGRW